MQTIRDLNAVLAAPILKLTGYRFSKNFRHGVTVWHRAVYAMVNTVQANYKAGMGPYIINICKL